MKIYTRCLHSIKENIKLMVGERDEKGDAIELINDTIDNLNEQKKKEGLFQIFIDIISRMVEVLTGISEMINESDEVNVGEICAILDREIIYIECKGNEDLYKYRSEKVEILSGMLHDLFTMYDDYEKFYVTERRYELLNEVISILQFIDTTLDADEGISIRYGFFHKMLNDIRDIVSTDMYSFIVSTKRSDTLSDKSICWKYIQTRIRNRLDYIYY